MDDAETLKRCQHGEREAFRHLVERYQKRAVAHALAILFHRGDAEDAVQEAFIDVFRAIGRFDTLRTFYQWFYVLLPTYRTSRLGQSRCGARHNHSDRRTGTNNR